MAALDLIQQRQTIQPAALHPDIKKDQPRQPVADRRQRTVAVKGGAGFVPFVGQDTRDDFADVLPRRLQPEYQRPSVLSLSCLSSAPAVCPAGGRMMRIIAP